MKKGQQCVVQNPFNDAEVETIQGLTGTVTQVYETSGVPYYFVERTDYPAFGKWLEPEEVRPCDSE